VSQKESLKKGDIIQITGKIKGREKEEDDRVGSFHLIISPLLTKEEYDSYGFPAGIYCNKPAVGQIMRMQIFSSGIVSLECGIPGKWRGDDREKFDEMPFEVVGHINEEAIKSIKVH